MAFEIFHRYRAIIDDWPAFLDALQRPLPTCIWTNTLRTTPSCLEKRLRQDGISVEPVGWYDGAFRLSPEESIGNRLEYLVGLCHVQEEVALVPAVLLDPQPGECILELCSAPGNKVAQMAMRMQNRGTIVANDLSYTRMRALRRIVNRLGLLNVSTTLFDAVFYPRQPALFDRVLVDVPCSCEGTSRKNPEVLDEISNLNARQLYRLQMAILNRALHLCKPGGRVVYSTCTYASEENEIVVQTVLDSLQHKIPARIIEVNLPGLTWSPGLQKWEGQTFRADMPNALRFYPHQNDTGGFFVAVVEKLDEMNRQQVADRSYNLQSKVDEVGPHPYLNYLEERFGIPADVFREAYFFRSNSRSIGIINHDHQPVTNPPPHFVGLPFIHTNMKYPKLTTAAALAFGVHATRNVIQVDHAQANDYLSGKPLALDKVQAVGLTDEGYVLVKLGEITLGLAVFLKRTQGGEIRSLFPKAWQLAED